MSSTSQARRRLLTGALAAGVLSSPAARAAGGLGCLATTYPHPFVSAGFTPWAISSPVGWVFSADYAHTGTCFLIADDWIASASHVMGNAKAAAGRVIVFNYLAEEAPAARDAYALSPYVGGYLGMRDNAGHDFCLIRVTRKKGQLPPGKRWGVLSLKTPAPLSTHLPVTLIHHPDRLSPTSPPSRPTYQHYKCVSPGQIVKASDPACVHSACAEEGSSGAPLIAPDGRLAGIHIALATDDINIEIPHQWRATTTTAIVAQLRRCRLTPEQAALIGA